VQRDGHRYRGSGRSRSADGPIVLCPRRSTTEASVTLVQRRLIAAALVALLVALVLGWVPRPCTPAASAGSSRRPSGSLPVASTSRCRPRRRRARRAREAFDRMRVRLAQLDTARKEFIANASHELRTPLFSLEGSSS
jgi:signal transduction histidine kinase